MEEISGHEPVSRPAVGDPDSIGRLCHELRQPLVVAVGYVSMLDDGTFGELPAEASSVIRIVAERLVAMNAIIDKLAAADAPSPLE